MARPASSKSAPRGGGSSSSRGRGRQAGSSSSSRAFNEAQAKARHERKAAKGGPTSINDVYDYAQSQVSNKGKGRGKAQSRALAGADEADPAPQRRANKKQRQAAGGEDDDDEEITSEEESSDEDGPSSRFPKVFDDDEAGPSGPNFDDHDSDIDSDEAFGESDEERFADWKFRGSTKNNGPPKNLGKPRAGQASDEDEEEDSEEEDDEDMMDLSKMLDGGSDAEDDDDEEDSEGEGDNDEQLLDKMNAIAAGTKRSADSDDGPSSKRSKAGGDFHSFGDEDDAGGLVTIEDLLEPIANEKGMSTFRANARVIAASSKSKQRSDGKEVKASHKGAGTLDAPLPSIIQDRIDRNAAYEVTKTDVEGWQPTIKRIREAEHLSFPLQSKPEMRPSTNALVGNYQAMGHSADSLEGQVAALLSAGGLSEKQMQKAEELQMKDLDPEEVKRRHAELRRMRELMFRAEQKAKRVKKIKSKTYRKVHRKERERELQKLRDAGLLEDPAKELDLELDSDEDPERIEAERKRAQERATLKHKNQSKWAKSILGRRHQLPAEAQQAIHDQLAKGDELRKKIEGVGSDEDSDSYDEDSVSGSEDEEAIREKAFDELADLEDAEDDEREEAEITGGKTKSGLLGMKFMKDARERERQQGRQMADDLRRELEGEVSEAGASGDAAKISLGSGGGRAVYGTQQIKSNDAQPTDEAPTVRRVKEIQAAQDAETSTASQKERKGVFETTLPAQELIFATAEDAEEEDASEAEGDATNPWLAIGSKSGNKLSKKRNEASVSKASSAESRALNKIARHKSRGDDARQADELDAAVEIDPHALIGAAAGGAKGKQAGKKAKKATVLSAEANAALDSDDDEDDSDDDEEVVTIEGPGRRAALRQKELMAEAFANDDVAADFAAEKRAIMAAEAPRVEDNTLPGWGNWGGKGVKKSAADKRKERERRERFSKVVPGWTRRSARTLRWRT